MILLFNLGCKNRLFLSSKALSFSKKGSQYFPVSDTLPATVYYIGFYAQPFKVSGAGFPRSSMPSINASYGDSESIPTGFQPTRIFGSGRFWR
jgi:hypothetical protein